MYLIPSVLLGIIAKPLHCDWEFVMLFLLLIIGLPKSLTVSSLTGLVDKEEILVR